MISVAPKYLIEMLLVTVLILVITFNINNNPYYLTLLPKLTFYLFAGYRIMPMLQTIFNNYGSIKAHTAGWEAIKLSLYQNDEKKNINETDKNINLNFENSIEVKNLSFNYSKDIPF